MPHIVLENINTTKQAFDSVEIFSHKIEGGILKVMDKYISQNNQTALIECLAIENGNNQNFFVQITQKKNSLTVRLLPLTDPQKSDGVKIIMATIAKQIKESNEQILYGKNNLADFLINA